MVDFSRSFDTVRVDYEGTQQPETTTDSPPFDLNNYRTPLDCVMRAKDKRSGETYQVVLGPCAAHPLPLHTRHLLEG